MPDLIDAAAFVAEPLDEPPELVVGLLHVGSKLVLGGGSKSYKTWVLLDLAISVATGADWIGRQTTQGKVLFLNFEIQPHAWQRRIAAVAKGIAVALTGATTVSAKALWEKSPLADGTGEGLVNDYRAIPTNQVLNNGVIFGNWKEAILGMFGKGIDILVNPYSRDTDGVVRLTASSYADVGKQKAVAGGQAARRFPTKSVEKEAQHEIRPGNAPK